MKVADTDLYQSKNSGINKVTALSKIAKRLSQGRANIKSYMGLCKTTKFVCS